MKTKFDLEEDIAKIWSVKDQVDMLYRWHGDGPVPMSEDEVSNHLLAISNHLLAISNHLGLLADTIMDTYCQVFELDQYTSAEVKALRGIMLKSKDVKVTLKKVKK